MSRSDVRIGRIAGIPVHVNWTVVVLVWLLGSVLITNIVPTADPGLSPIARLALGLAGAVAFLGSILAHELGHAVVARRGGVPVESISLWLFGGVARMAGETPRPGLALRVSAAGPAVSLAIGAAGIGLEVLLHRWGAAPGVAAVAAWLGGINLLLAAFNLLPGLPLDGGRILEAALWSTWGDRARAVRAAATAGRVLGFGFVALGGMRFMAGETFSGLWLAGIGFFLASSARAEAQGQQARTALDGVRAFEVMSPVVPSAPSYLTVEEFLRDHVAHSSQGAWTVYSWGGELEGLVSVDQLVRLPGQQRPHVHLRELARPIAEVPWARPYELVLDVLARSHQEATLVVAEGQVVGIITAVGLQRAIEGRARVATP